ncbi:MAG: hypothetical protein WC529_07505 [Candidatus Margulisiibacteriota bacterium]
MKKTGLFLMLVSAVVLLTTASFAAVKPFQIIDSVSPSSIMTGESHERITITGRDLQHVTTVEFTPAAGLTIDPGTLTVVSDSQITFDLTCDVTAEAVARNIRVIKNDGSSYEVFAGLMVVNLAVTPPAISGMSPSGANAGETVFATIEGALFDPAAVVSNLSSSITITSYEVVTSGRITVGFSVSSAASGGVAPFVVTNPDSGYATYNFAVTNTDPAFAVVGVFPPMPSFPRDANNDITVSNFALYVTGVSQDATVSFSDPNVKSSQTVVSPEALIPGTTQRGVIFLGTLTIGKAATGSSVQITVNNPDGTTASTSINLIDKNSFADYIGLILAGPSFYTPEDEIKVNAIMNKLPSSLQFVMVGPSFSQKTDFTVPTGGGTVFAAGSGPGKVRSLTVHPLAGEQARITIKVPARDDLGKEQLGMLIGAIRIPENNEMKKLRIVIAR